MSIFEGQELLRFVLKTSYDNLASASVKRIYWIKPNGAKGYWDATVDGQTLYYDVVPGDIDQIGVWKFESYVEIGGKALPGEVGEKRILRTII